MCRKPTAGGSGNKNAKCNLFDLSLNLLLSFYLSDKSTNRLNTRKYMDIGGSSVLNLSWHVLC